MKPGLIMLSVAFLARSLPAVVIVNDATLTATPPAGHYTLALTQSIPPGQGLFSISFGAVGGGVFQFNASQDLYSVAEEFRLFLANDGTQFDPQYVSSHTPLFTNAAPANWSISIPLNSSLVIAYWDDRTFSAALPAATDNYGWVRLTNTPAGLVASAGATAIGGGIIVGTTTQVPEPSAVAVVLVALAASALRRSREQRNG